MHQPTDSGEYDVDRRIDEVKAQIGELVVELERLSARRDRAAPSTGQAGAPADGGPGTGTDENGADRTDQVVYVRTTRRSMYRVLYAVDFTLVHGRIDHAMLRDARRELVEGIDAADACLMLDGAHDLPYDTD